MAFQVVASVSVSVKERDGRRLALTSANQGNSALPPVAVPVKRAAPSAGVTVSNCVVRPSHAQILMFDECDVITDRLGR